MFREHEATKRSTVQGNLAADFELSFNNQSRARSSVYHLFRVVQSGALDGIPVKEGSLSVHGMGSVLRSKKLYYKPTNTFPLACFAISRLNKL